MHQFSISESIQYGWKTTKANFSFFIKAILLMFAIEILSSMVGQSLKNSHATKSLADLLFWVVQTVVNIGLIKVALKFYDHQKADLKDLYDHYPLFLKYILGTFLYGIIVALG